MGIRDRDDSYISASESCALTAIGAQFLRYIKPGEIVTITREGITSNLTLCQSRPLDLDPARRDGTENQRKYV